MSNTLQNLGEGVAVLISGSLQLVNGNYVPFSVGTAQSELDFCSSERFSEQEVIPTAFCSGFLLSKNPPLLATAAHCVSDGTSNTTVVFRYELFDNDGTNLVYDDSDVYTISQVITQGIPDGRESDYALVRLDRAVTGRDAYDSATSNVDVGDSTIMIGHPTGLPKKYDSGGAITAIQSNGALLRATVDAYGGNSGSPVFNNDRDLIGILVAGGTDFNDASGCRTSNFCPGGLDCDANGEYIVPICTLLNRSEVQSVLDLQCDDNNSNSNNSNSNNSNSNSSSSNSSNDSSNSNSNNSNSNNSSNDSSSSSVLISSLAVVLCIVFFLF